MLDYEDCEAEELHSFAEQRGLPLIDMPSETKMTRSTSEIMKRHYIPALQHADQHPYFPDFMGLPPEMRMMVYDELLGDLDSAKFNVGILSVNRLIHREAAAILWDRNSFQIRVTEGFVFTEYKKTRPYHPVIPAELFKPRWSEFLRKVRHLRIEFAVDTTRRRWPEYCNAQAGDAAARVQDELSLLNHLLFSLCSFLSGRNDLKSLRLKLSMIRGGIKRQHSVLRDPHDVIQCLKPLSMIAPLPDITIEGAAPTVATQVTSALMGARLQPGIILGSWKYVYAAAKCCQRMRKAADGIPIPRPYSRSWQNLVDIANAVAQFDRILSHNRRGQNHTPQMLVTRTEELKLEIKIKTMREGLQRFRYRPKTLRTMEQEFARANEALVANIDQKQSELTNLIGELDTMIGRGNVPAITSDNLGRATVMFLASRGAQERLNDSHWWLEAVVRFDEAKQDLDKALAHRALRRVLVVRLPMTDMLAVHGILANTFRHTPLVDRLKSVRLGGTKERRRTI